jgi:hypothetical protein
MLLESELSAPCLFFFFHILTTLYYSSAAAASASTVNFWLVLKRRRRIIVNLPHTTAISKHPQTSFKKLWQQLPVYLLAATTLYHAGLRSAAAAAGTQMDRKKERKVEEKRSK